ncbi:bifunctional diguanylate cyclase/phosphodiesterase [Pseudidiomarina sediminum]|uniref:Bifunctional diguanylate cyclase/phosphodiesterase n=1 Tax=Pseudidiomarina sediminum TaxID=431675 RepID=A0A432YZD5_9GAMM|nr:EAL domain-containing protein [Pseudidiomarina sediminum]RUO68988.1 bifunctional diguanylate cyclase/phosphodiesterase [Pseudidiomarina sediminum]
MYDSDSASPPPVMNSEQALHLLAQNLQNAHELQFIDNLAELLSKLLGADHVLFAEVFDDTPDKAHIVSFYSHGALQQPVTYSLRGSPCEQVLDRDICHFSADVCTFFPQDVMLQELGAASYVGVPMLTVESQKIGLLAVLDDSPTDYPPAVLDVLQIAASQAAAELVQLRMTGHLLESERRLQTLMDALPGMAYRCKNDELWTMEFVSRGAFELTGYHDFELVNNRRKAWLELTHPNDVEMSKRMVAEAVAEDSYFTFTYRLKRADGSFRWMWEQGKGVRNSEGEVSHFEGFILDITEQHQHQEHIADIAFHDELTGLPNRAALLHQLQHAYQQDTDDTYVMYLLDLRDFRTVNESFGLSAGDRVLNIVALRLNEAMEANGDFVSLARITGDEFVVLTRVASIDDAGMRATIQRLKQLFTAPMLIGSQQVTIDVRVSAAQSLTANSASELLQHASIAMHELKSNGLELCIYDLVLAEKVLSARHYAERFIQALEQKTLSIHLQPQVDLVTGECIGAEVLCRWFDDELGNVPPSVFIAIACERGILSELGKLVLEQTSHWVRAWQQRYQDIPQLSINIGAQQLASAAIVDDVKQFFHDIDAEQVCFEITESDLMIDPRLALNVTRQLRELGYQLAIDDFGTGYSSLAYLQQFEVDVLKIDISFVQAMMQDKPSKTLVNTIIAMARSLELKTVAEGIETEAQSQLLREMGCDFGQGYYFARPIAPEEFETKWLIQRK